jgi:HK97 family phage major capsid protein
MNIKELRQKRADLRNEALGILDKADAEKRVPTTEESARLDAIKVEQADNDRAITAEEYRMELRRKSEPLDEPIERVEVGVNRATLEPWGGEPRQGETADQRSERARMGFGNMLIAARRATQEGGRIDPRLKPQAAATGSNEYIGSEGGFLVDVDQASTVWTRSYETSVLASRCTRVPISAGANSLKVKGVDESSRVNGSRWGGVQAYWAAEADSVTATKPKFRLIELQLRKLFATYYATDELIKDAIALGSIAQQAFGEELGFKLDDAIMNGTGAGQPLGVLTSNALVSVAMETGQSATTLVAQNVIKAHARMWARSRAKAAWFINQDVEPQLHQMSLPVGTGGLPVYMPEGGLSQSPYATLYGRPVIPIEHCATLGTVGDIVFADLSQYLLIDKGGVQADASIHVKFVNDETTFRYIMRVDGAPLWNVTLRPYKGNNTLSPFVAVATRS